MFGSHLSIAGGMHHALLEAQRLGMDCVQVFTKNQRQWSAKPLGDDEIVTWHEHRASTGITDVVSHDSYLINLASPKRDVREKSIKLFIDELDRCEKLAIPHLVTHPGAHLNIGEEKGIDRVAAAFDRIHKKLPDCPVVTCLEITAGQGTTLGYTLEHLRAIIDRVDAPGRLAVCLDTAHALAAGYDLTSERGARDFCKQIDSTVGLGLVKCVHVNDSKVERGKRVDRHAHIGQGHVSLGAFRVICRKFKAVPKILETPKEDAPDGTPMDTVNLEKLRELVKPQRRARR